MSRPETNPDPRIEPLSGQMTLLGHLEELQRRLVKSAIALLITTIISATFTTQILTLLIAPYGQKLQVLGPTEGITIYFRVALLSGLVLAMPFLVYQFLMFVLPGLEPNEKRYVYWGVPAAFLLFMIGVCFAWFILLPSAIGFLADWQTEIFEQEWQSQKYIPFVTSLIFWIGLSFETPLIIFIMAKLNLVTPQFLLKQWRFAVVIIAIMAAMITPTVDPFNMALVMLPLIVLYGISILLAYLA
jgi:sec-independent protein translocase protein TatC